MSYEAIGIIYTTILQAFLSTFSSDIRDCVSKVIEVRLWYHENTRVIGDRLIDNIDRSFLSNLMQDLIKTKFNITKEQMFNSERIIFADFLEGIDVETRIYR